MTTPVPSPGLSPDGSNESLTGSLADSSAGIRPIRHVSVIGLGLIGGSLARDLAMASDVVLVGWDADSVTRAEARAARIPVAETLAECVAGEPDLVVLAVPLAVMTAVCRELSPLVGGPTLVTDLGSVKARVREAIDASGLGERYVGSHPMAGTEGSGFMASTPGMFQDAAWVMTVAATSVGATVAPSTSDRAPATAWSNEVAIQPAAELNAVLTIADLVTRVLGVRVYVMTDDQHDEAVALISHLPHVFAAELLSQASLSPEGDLALTLAAGSFRDGTRVAGTNPARTEAMIAGNAAWVAPIVERAAARLQSLAVLLRAGDDVAAFFTQDVLAPEVRAEGGQASTPAPDATSTSGAEFDGGRATAPEIVDAADLDWLELRTLLLDAAARGRAIRAVDLRARTLTLATSIS